MVVKQARKGLCAETSSQFLIKEASRSWGRASQADGPARAKTPNRKVWGEPRSLWLEEWTGGCEIKERRERITSLYSIPKAARCCWHVALEKQKVLFLWGTTLLFSVAQQHFAFPQTVPEASNLSTSSPLLVFCRVFCVFVCLFFFSIIAWIHLHEVSKIVQLRSKEQNSV